MKARHHLEDDLHIAVVRYLSLALPDDAFWFHVPNGGKRGKAEAGRFKAMGVKAGVPDIVIIYGGAPYFIELKADKGRLSKAQRETLEALVKAEAVVKVCRSLEEVSELLDWEWEIPLKARPA
jgi:hypothetical protein